VIYDGAKTELKEQTESIDQIVLPSIYFGLSNSEESF
jgi:hypothetical protein